MTIKNNDKKLGDTKGKILKATSELITEKGVKSTSLADISKRVGISKGTLYYYYASKDDIIYDITNIHLKHMTKELLIWIENLGNDVSADKVLNVVFDKILNDDTRGKLHLYLISDAVIGNNSLKQRFIQNYREWRKTLESGLKIILKDKSIDPEILSNIILAILDGFTIQKMLGITDLSISNVTKLLSNID